MLLDNKDTSIFVLFFFHCLEDKGKVLMFMYPTETQILLLLLCDLKKSWYTIMCESIELTLISLCFAWKMNICGDLLKYVYFKKYEWERLSLYDCNKFENQYLV